MKLPILLVYFLLSFHCSSGQPWEKSVQKLVEKSNVVTQYQYSSDIINWKSLGTEFSFKIGESIINPSSNFFFTKKLLDSIEDLKVELKTAKLIQRVHFLTSLTSSTIIDDLMNSSCDKLRIEMVKNFVLTWKDILADFDNLKQSKTQLSEIDPSSTIKVSQIYYANSIVNDIKNRLGIHSANDKVEFTDNNCIQLLTAFKNLHEFFNQFATQIELLK